MPPLINATGTIFHSAKCVAALAEEAAMTAGAAALSPRGEYEGLIGGGLLTDRRLEELLCHLTGAEDVLVVNNIYSAALLLFQALPRGEEILLFREELQGDNFAAEIHALLKQRGARLRKIARKELEAFFRKTSPTGDELFCLVSIDGCSTPATGDSLPFSRFNRGNFLTVKILRCAALMDLQPFGFTREMQVKEILNSGFDAVIFPGDRLVGGPPVGIIAGKESLLSSLRKNSLGRALQADGILLSALEATLELYLEEEKARERIPLLRMITAPVENIAERARRLAEILKGELEENFEVGFASENARLTWNGLPETKIPSRQITLNSPKLSALQLGALLFKGDPPVISRIKKGRVLLDLRTVLEREDELLLRSLLTSLKQNKTAVVAGNNVLDSVPSLIWVLNRENELTYVNRACAAFFGLEAGSLRGKRLEDLIEGEEGKLLLEAAGDVLARGEQLRLETRLHDRWLEITVTPVVNAPEEKGGVTFTATDITERKRHEEELKYYSMHDPLTGLYNRVYFEEEIRRLNTERHYPISVVVCDLDGLKLINDIMGHGQGDELLKAAAEIIRKPFRSSDVVARVGGDEFAVILPFTDESIVREIAGRIQKAVENYNREKNGIPLSLSVGYATAYEPSRGIAEIFKEADSNMYKNKFERSEGVKKKIIDYLLFLLAEKESQDEQYEERLQRMVFLLGQALGLPYEELKKMMLLAKIHDIGKLGIDDSILLKKEALNSREWEEIKRHPEIGYHIARSTEEMAPLAEYILQHHERWNGSGYPRGLKGTEIHLYSRILAIVDAYEAMISPRPYRGPLSHEEAIRELKKNSGSQFDPRLVDIFISLMEEQKS